MALLTRMEDFQPPPDGVVLTIGNFDGVHRGHASLLEIARRYAEPRKLPIVVMTFDPHPLALLRPAEAPPTLTTTREKAALLEGCGATTVLALPTDRELLSLAPEAFLDRYVLPCRPKYLVEGPNFRFGRGARGNSETLERYLEPHGCEVHIAIEARRTGGLAINSTAVRAALGEGDVALASEMLGRAYRVSGRVVRGDGRGGPLGFPTANLGDVPQLVPGYGVYAGVAQTESDDWYLTAVNVGPQPTFDGDRARIEAHLLDFSGDLREQQLGVHFVARLRGQVKFDSVQALRTQLDADIAATRRADGLGRCRGGAGRIALP